MNTTLSIVLIGTIALAAWLAGCSGSRHEAVASALASDRPPPDFWLAVTVLRAPAEAGSRAAAYQRLPVSVRPARYVVEADRVLRAATGSGASEETFPAQTRQLTEEQFASLWQRLRGSSLAAGDLAARVGRGPRGSEVGEKTVYVVSFEVAGDQRMLAIDAGPEAGDAADLVEELARLVWVE